MYLVKYIIYIAELGNTPGRRRLVAVAALELTERRDGRADDQPGRNVAGVPVAHHVGDLLVGRAVVAMHVPAQVGDVVGVAVGLQLNQVVGNIPRQRLAVADDRSEERRVGKECRSRAEPY